MRRHGLVAALLAALLPAGCATPARTPVAPAVHAEDAAVAPASTFANPLDLDYRFMPDAPSRRTAADPVIVLYRDTYYLFATGAGGYWRSPDLRHWTLVVPQGLPLDAPAPAVLVDGDRVYYTAHKLGAMYASDDPARGVWRRVAALESYADPMLFRDDDGRVYLYHGAALDGSIRAVELDPARGFAVIGGPYTLMSADYRDHGWERSGPENLGIAGMAEGFRIAPYVEGPWMTKHDGTYYLQYSAPGTIWKTYADGVYTSRSPTGPFTYEPYSPFSYKPGGFIGGAGHGALFRDRQGRYWRVVTMIISVAHRFERRIGLFPAGFDSDGVMRTDTYLGDYPQYLPGTRDAPLGNNRVGWMLLSGGRPARASSTLDGHPPDLAFDEDVRTQWSAATGRPGEWLRVDLGAPSRVHALQVNFGEQDARALGRDSSVYERYRVEASDDGRRWTTLVDRSAGRRDAPHEYVQLARPVTTRYLRIVNLHTAGGGSFAVRGLRVFGRGPGPLPAPVGTLAVRRDASDGRDAVLTWTPAADARRYVVRYGIAPDELYASYEVGPRTRLELHALNRGVTYYFTVDAVNERGVTRGARVTEAPDSSPAPRPAEATQGADRWWRGNLHTHTLWSDGNEFPEMVAGWYRGHGYHFVVLTDHNSTETGERWVSLPPGSPRLATERRYRARFGAGGVRERRRGDTLQVRLRPHAETAALLDDPGRFVVVPGEELSDEIGGKPVHVTVVNARDAIAPRGGATVAALLRNDLEAVAARQTAERPLLAVLNHPNFFRAVGADELAAVDAVRFFEVYNGSVRVGNEGDATHPGTERMWDEALAARLRRGGPLLYGVASDDAHHFEAFRPEITNPGRGWVCVRADELSVPALLDALRRGDFYASTGVELRDVRRAGERIELRIAAQPGVTYITRFIGTRSGGPVGEVLAEVPGVSPAYRLRGDELYVRAKVVSSRTKSNGYRPDEREVAWTQPFSLAGGSAHGASNTPRGS
jgi:hypothetical protein